MKVFFSLFMLICVVCVLNAEVSYKSVIMENYGSAVTRVVVSFSGQAETGVSTSSNSLELRVSNLSPGSQASIGYKSGGLLTGIEQNGETISISAKSPVRVEQLSLGKSIALDVFVSNPNKAQRLEIADFYSEKGKLNSADKAYNDLHIDYREDMQILYNWALLLAKRGSARATDKLSMIPSSSSYYPKAQALMAKIHGDEEPVPPPPPIYPLDKIHAAPAKLETTEPTSMPADSIVRAPVPETKPAPLPKPVAKKSPLMGFLPMLAVEALLLGIFIWVIYLAIKRKKPGLDLDEPESLTETSSLDTNTMCRMVSKLLSDGWTLREISKEMKIPVKEVEHLVQLCHRGGHDEQNS